MHPRRFHSAQRRQDVTPVKTRQPRTSTGGEKQLGLKIDPVGPTPEQFAALAQRVAKDTAVQTMLSKTQHRLLYVDLLDVDDDAKPERPRPPDRFRATFYDYTNNRTVFATGNIAGSRALEVIESGLQLPPSAEEFDEAVQILQDDADVGPGIRE